MGTPPTAVPAEALPIIIDVRSPVEFSGGAVHGAINVPLPVLEWRIRELAPQKDTPVALYCASGARSGLGCQLLQRLGYANAFNAGGRDEAALALARVVA